MTTQFADAYNNQGIACAEQEKCAQVRADWEHVLQLGPHGEAGRAARVNLRSLKGTGH